MAVAGAFAAFSSAPVDWTKYTWRSVSPPDLVSSTSDSSNTGVSTGRKPKRSKVAADRVQHALEGDLVAGQQLHDPGRRAGLDQAENSGMRGRTAA